MLEELLCKQIQNDSYICGALAPYQGMPAFFYQKAPEDTDPGWDKPCYPRMDYNVDMHEDPERKISGTAVFNVWCSEESSVMPEDIEPKLIQLISGTFYTGTDQTFCAIWERSDAFEYDTNRTQPQEQAIPRIFGLSVVFDITAFPIQITTDPDPILAINRWTSRLFPDTVVIGEAETPDIWKPSDQRPAVYWRFVNASTDDKQSYASVWYDCQLAGHVITDNVMERNRWLKVISESLSVAGEVIMHDNSPMFVKKVDVLNGADQLHAGQLTLFARYGILTIPRKIPTGHLLNNAHFRDEEKVGKFTVSAKQEIELNQHSDVLPGVDERPRLSVESVYRLKELMAASGRFGASPDCIQAAFLLAGKIEATISEAEQIINAFMNHEVD